MKLALIGDSQLISDADPYKSWHQNRHFFKSAWPSFRDLLRLINAEAPDLVLLDGDLVDWFSTQNVDFVLDLLSILKAPWETTPGNHDLVTLVGDPSQEEFTHEYSEVSYNYWVSKGLDFSNHLIENDELGIVLMYCPRSDLPEGSDKWLDEVLPSHQHNLLLTHVPVDLPFMRE